MQTASFWWVVDPFSKWQPTSTWSITRANQSLACTLFVPLKAFLIVSQKHMHSYWFLLWFISSKNVLFYVFNFQLKQEKTTQHCPLLVKRLFPSLLTPKISGVYGTYWSACQIQNGILSMQYILIVKAGVCLHGCCSSVVRALVALSRSRGGPGFN